MRPAGAIGLSLGSIGALAGLLLLVLKKGPIAALGLLVGMSAALLVVSVIAAFFGKKKNG